MTTLAKIEDSTAESLLREMFYREYIPYRVKKEALEILQQRCANIMQILPLVTDKQYGILPTAMTLLNSMSAFDVQTVILANEMLQCMRQMPEIAGLAMLLKTYREERHYFDALVSVGESAAALCRVYLEQQYISADTEKIFRFFGCSSRRTAYYSESLKHFIREQEEKEA